MVQCLLSCRWRTLRVAGVTCAILLLLTPAFAAKEKKPGSEPQAVPELLLEGGRKLTFERILSSEKDVRGKPGFFTRLVDVVIGAPEYKRLVRPYSIAVDSRGRAIVTDPGIGGVHIFDAAQHKYKFLERKEKSKDSMFEPQCVTVDAKDNIYVTDSKAGKIFVFDSNGKYRAAFGSLKGGEGFYKRPTGIAIDPDTQQIYVTDTLRDKIFVLDPNGQVMRSIGKHGEGNGEFNYPTELLIKNGVLAVVDAMNFRVQTFALNGTFQGVIGQIGDSSGQFFRPKAIGLDSEDHIYVAEAAWGMVQVFDRRQGQLLYTFGKRGTRAGEFQLPTGMFIDANDRVYVVDSFNARVQVFQYHGIKTGAEGAKK